MTDLVQRNNALPSNETLLDSLANLKTATTVSSGDAILRLAKNGVFTYGAEEVEVEDGSQWAVNPYSFETGYCCWDGGVLIDERMAPITNPTIDPAQLPHHEAGWRAQLSIRLTCLTGADEGVDVLYKTTSVGAKRAINKLTDALIKRLLDKETDIVPVIHFEVDSYRHKTYGTVFVPVLEIVAWVNPNEAKPEEVEEEEPVQTRRGRPRKVAKPAEEEDRVVKKRRHVREETEEAPTKRVRRRRT